MLTQGLNSYQGYLNFQKTEQSKVLSQLDYKTIALFAGNRAGKTATIAKDYEDRRLGVHNIEWKNRINKVRCISSSLPESSDPNQTDNAQYIELKKLIPYECIVKDITARSGNLVVTRPVGISSEPLIYEFRSSKQELQDLGKINVSSVWHDEETPADKRIECKARLIQEDGDELFSITTSNSFSYVYDDVFLQASYIYRTKVVSEYTGEPRVERKNGNPSIACIFMATDDNPILNKDAIDRIFEDIVDPDEIALRRYGVFKQISGRIVKTYNPRICYISYSKYFPEEIPHEWFHMRGIDYHMSRTPWSVGWGSVSPEDEWFLWREFHPAIDGHRAMNSQEIAKHIVRNSGDYEYTVNLIDPLAQQKQPNTLFSTVDDLNRYFMTLRETARLGTPCFWESWDTKGGAGRNEISKRFKNACMVGKPFNNRTKERGMSVTIPTLWIMDTCPNFNKSILNWRFGEFVTSNTKAVNDPKGTPQQKWSHDNMVLEAWGKDARIVGAPVHFLNKGVKRRWERYIKMI